MSCLLAPYLEDGARGVRRSATAVEAFGRVGFAQAQVELHVVGASPSWRARCAPVAIAQHVCASVPCRPSGRLVVDGTNTKSKASWSVQHLR